MRTTPEEQQEIARRLFQSEPRTAVAPNSVPSIPAAAVEPSKDATPEPTAELPAHSPLGASGAERWMKCPGSVTLAKTVRALGRFEEDEPEYRAEGVLAHAVGAHCLQTGTDTWTQLFSPQWPALTAELAHGAQTYLDYVRSRVAYGAQLEVEQRMHRPNIHPLFFGTLDAFLSWPPNVPTDNWIVEIVDYKNGAGVVVDVQQNAQASYYALGKLDELNLPDSTVVRLTIVQPNAYHPDGPIRSWDTTAGELRQWLRVELLPAMNRAGTDEYAMGEHCRFCPAKLACPLMTDMVKRVLTEQACHYKDVPLLKMAISACEKEEYARLVSGKESTGGKLVMKKVDRVWKGGADVVLARMFGPEAYTEPKLISPAVAEKLPGGDTLVAEWAFKPEAGLTVAPLDDKRAEMRPPTAAGLFGAAVQRVLTGAE